MANHFAWIKTANPTNTLYAIIDYIEYIPNCYNQFKSKKLFELCKLKKKKN